MGCGKSKASSFQVADTDGDGSVNVKELAKVLEAQGEPNASARAKELMEKFDANRDGVLQEGEYRNFIAEITANSSTDDDKSHVHELAQVHPSDPLRAIAGPLIAEAKATCATMPKDGACGFVLADHNGKEVACSCEPKGKMLITLARGKIYSLFKLKGDLSKLNRFPPIHANKLVPCLAGMSKEFPVEGIVLVEYMHPDTKQAVRGYFAVSGRSTTLDDLHLCREGARKSGLKETETANVFRLG
ncbi:hypothetical protein CYMTET_16005 [Cymbomonas tetramitiformis]|uniref:EF-hand domain-containing protein n=1 Tax=Cymbomonas tetramitiformis TaxID=36881 RepID=A0AAE0GD25_9CHLO|nr:hypothetical protein CYMTET_16005 [Cymbomonas tetramitiformis]